MGVHLNFMNITQVVFYYIVYKNLLPCHYIDGEDLRFHGISTRDIYPHVYSQL